MTKRLSRVRVEVQSWIWIKRGNERQPSLTTVLNQSHRINLPSRRKCIRISWKLYDMVDHPKESAHACHNCRRSRLKCDKTLPHCLKCGKKGQQCLGYQRLLRWERGIASRGKMAGVVLGASLGEAPKHRAKEAIYQVSTPECLNDPFVQDMSDTTKMYLKYCRLHSSAEAVTIDQCL